MTSWPPVSLRPRSVLLHSSSHELTFSKIHIPSTCVALSSGKVDARWRTYERAQGSGPEQIGDNSNEQAVTIAHMSPSITNYVTRSLWSYWRLSLVLRAGMTIQCQLKLPSSLVTFTDRKGTAQAERHASPAPPYVRHHPCASTLTWRGHLWGWPIQMQKSCFSMV